MGLFSVLADVGLSFLGDDAFSGFETRDSPGTELPSLTQTTTTDVRVGGSSLSQVVSIDGRAVPVVAPSTAFQPFQLPQVTPAFFDDVTRFEGPTTVQNIPWLLVLSLGLAAFAFGKFA